jgi:hypothetical protein
MTTRKPSDQARLVAGTFIEDAAPKLKGLQAWLTEQCRTTFRGPIAEFAATQEEAPDPNLVLVEGWDETMLHCLLPARVCDHESKSTFLVEVRFKLNPRDLSLRRQ